MTAESSSRGSGGADDSSAGAIDAFGGYASAYRPADEETRVMARFVDRSPVTTALLESVSGGWCAIVDRHRQIVGATEGFRKMAGCDDLEELIGQRIGEALRCVNSETGKGGCGTTPWCSTCAAAIAMSSAQACDEPITRRGVLERMAEDGDVFETHIVATCVPIQSDGPDLHLFRLAPDDSGASVSASDPFWDVLQDLSRRLVELSRGSAGGWACETVPGGLPDLVGRLGIEVDTQILRLRGPEGVVAPDEEFALRELADALDGEVRSWIEASGIPVVVEWDVPDARMRCARRLVHIVLRGMLSNALEASQGGDVVRCRALLEDGRIVFSVSNPEAILPHFALRVFQRHFTTKDGRGRGQGTWMMKQIVERRLGGAVWFESSRSVGTVFHLAMPIHASSGRAPTG